jgi:hypothetical protein
VISDRASLLSRMSTALIIALGFTCVCAVAVVWLNEIRKGLFGPPTAYGYESLFIEPDGTILITTYRDQQREYRTLDGKPATTASEQTPMNGAYLFARKERYSTVSQHGWEGRVFPFADDARPATYWYFVVADESDDGRGYFAGYDAATRRSVGYLGREGFTSTEPARVGQFSVYGPGLAYIGTMFSSWNFRHTVGRSPSGPANFGADFAYPPWIVYLHSGSRFLKIDLRGRTVGAALDADDILSAGQVSRPDTSGAPVAGRGYSRTLETYVLRRPDRITLFNPADESSVDYRLHSELRDKDFAFYPFPEHTALLDIWSSDRLGSRGEHDLAWLDADGAITRREKLTLNQWRLVPSHMETTLLPALALPAPLFGGLFLLGDNPQDAYVNVVADQWLRAILVLLISVAAVALADRKQRRSGLPRSYAWLTFVFLLGLPGLVGYLLHRRWPIREHVPPPQRTGIEVFA